MMAKVLTLDQKETVLMCFHASERFWSSMQEASRNSETHWFTLFRPFFIFFVQTLPLFTNLASNISSGLPYFSPFFTSHLLILLFHLCLTNLVFGFTFLSERHSVLSTLSITTFYHFINNFHYTSAVLLKSIRKIIAFLCINSKLSELQKQGVPRKASH